MELAIRINWQIDTIGSYQIWELDHISKHLIISSCERLFFFQIKLGIL